MAAIASVLSNAFPKTESEVEVLWTVVLRVGLTVSLLMAPYGLI
jgi:hypothetical protein